MIQNYAKITKVLATSLGLTVEELVRSYDRAKAGDVAEICQLMHLGFGAVDNLSPEVIAWRYFDSSKNISDIFVLRYKGELIGAVGAEPIKVKVGEKEYDGIRAADIVVHPDHMKRGIGVWMNLHLQYIFPVVMAMGSNEKSDTMVRRLFTPINCRNHFKILFSVQSYLAIRGWPSLCINLIAPIAAFFLFVISRFSLASVPKGYSFSVSDNTEVMASFFSDPAYESRKKNIALRSAEFCRWRYDLNPKSHFSVFNFYKNEALIGYAVIRKDRDESNKDFRLMDWDLLPQYRDEMHLRILFGAAVRYARENGAHCLSVMTSEPLSIDSLRKTGFSHRALDDGFFLYARSDIAPEALDETNWFLSFCDTDEAL